MKRSDFDHYSPPTAPYSVGSREWPDLHSSDPDFEHPLDEMHAEQCNGVLEVFSKVYAIARLMTAIFLSYGVEVRTRPIR